MKEHLSNTANTKEGTDGQKLTTIKSDCDRFSKLTLFVRKYLLLIMLWDPFLDGPGKFSHSEIYNKISNLMITDLFYSMIFLIRAEVPFLQSFRTIHFSVFKIQITKNSFGFRKNGPKMKLWVCHLDP